MDTTGIQWPSIAIQGILLSNISIVFSQREGLINGYFLFSAVLVISLFIHQVISKRMLFLFPGNHELREPTPYIDTYILRVFIAISAASLCLGYIFDITQNEIIIHLEELFNLSFLYLAIFLFLIWPLFFGLCIKGKIREKINKRIREKKGADN
ncbi:MAG TPA: hypothetical protein VFG01_08755 [Acidobacteriota bacterium]|nr:hypothetical protein [Acidobacteriota bacterium]